MATQVILICSAVVGIFMTFLSLSLCIPIDVIYTGEGCECQTKLGYQVNLPKGEKCKSHVPSKYGYRVELPPPQTVRTKGKVSYNFDFTVEEPRTPKSRNENNRSNLFAKVDRITVNKGDCEEPSELSPPIAPPSCGCRRCGSSSRPSYRYVFDNMSPCNCQRSECKCNQRQSAFYAQPTQVTGAVGYIVAGDPTNLIQNHIRRRRDLHRAFFRPRKLDGTERSGRYVKQYHKSLGEDKKQNLFDFENIGVDSSNSNSKPRKRKSKKVLFPFFHSKIVKRDIKGEYDLLEKERQQMDLTVPEIIQFMPETLHPNFKREQCYFGCTNSKLRTDLSQGVTTKDDNKESLNQPRSNKYKEKTSMNSQQQTTEEEEEAMPDDNKNSKEELYYKKEENPNSENTIFTTSSYQIKRNAAKFNHETHSAAKSNAPSALNPLTATEAKNSQMPSIRGMPSSAYHAKRSTTIPQYVYDSLSHKHLQSDGDLHYIYSTALVPDPLPDPFSIDAELPLKYAGDLEISSFAHRTPLPYSRIANEQSPPLLGAPQNSQYSVQHVSDYELDRIIADIIYRHPDFIEATSHHGGALVDPETWQEQETKDFVKKLIDGRLHLWFGDEVDHSRRHPGYGRPLLNPYLPPPTLHDGHTLY